MDQSGHGRHHIGRVPTKNVILAGQSIDDSAGAKVDLTGGGNLFAYQFNSGLGGTNDILSSSTGSFAILPNYQAGQAGQADYAPIDLTKDSTGATPYANSSLTVGEQVYLAGGDGLPAGTYTLLPARYALLPGAFLVTPQSGSAPTKTALNPDGSVEMAGYLTTSLNPHAVPTVTGFEVDSATVVNSRAEYDILSANTFLKTSAVSNNQPVPLLPVDAGRLVFNATSSLQIQGGLLGQPGAGGQGSSVDIGSPDDIYIVSNSSSTPTVTSADQSSNDFLTLDADELDGFGANSLLIGGIRSSGVNGITIDPTTSAVYLQNDSNSALTGNEIILVSKQTVSLAAGADIEQTGAASGGVENLTIGNSAVAGSGDGAFLRVTSDPDATFGRLGVNPSDASANLVIGAGAVVNGIAVTLDSTSGTMIDSTAQLDQGSGVHQTLVLQSGQIALQIDPTVSLASATGLAINNAALQSFEKSVQQLSLLSYNSIDLYGSGVLGDLDSKGQPVVKSLSLEGAGIVGHDTNGGKVQINAQNVSINNSVDQSLTGTLPALPNDNSTLEINADTIQLGANAFTVDGYATVNLIAANGMLASGSGSLNSQGALTLSAPVVTGATGANYAFNASGALSVGPPVSPGTVAVTGGLGATLSLTGSGVAIASKVFAPSGVITVQATTGDVELQAGGTLDASGQVVVFNNVNGYTSGGQVNLTSANGQVALDAGSKVNVSAQPGGGNAGSVVVTTTKGTFTAADQTLQGTAGAGGTGGAFSATLDGTTGQTLMLSGLTTPLTDGGFQSIQLDVLNGSVDVDGAVGPTLASGQPGLTSFSVTTEQGAITVDNTINASGRHRRDHRVFRQPGRDPDPQCQFERRRAAIRQRRAGRPHRP